MVLQILFIAFVLFVLSRIVIRWRDGSISFSEFGSWMILWIGVGFVVLLPSTTEFLARILGVGRGADALVYVAIVILFYAIFRIVVKLEFIEHEITLIVRSLALKKPHTTEQHADKHQDHQPPETR